MAQRVELLDDDFETGKPLDWEVLQQDERLQMNKLHTQRLSQIQANTQSEQLYALEIQNLANSRDTKLTLKPEGGMSPITLLVSPEQNITTIDQKLSIDSAQIVLSQIRNIEVGPLSE